MARVAILCALTALLALGLATTSRAEEAWQTRPQPAPLPRASHFGLAKHAGARIYYSTYGAGPPVMLLHGGLANQRYWGDQVPALVKAHYRVVLIDSRGHGRSSRDGRPYTYELMASDVVAVMNVLHLRKAAVVGWSDGAIIGLVMALKDPDRVSRVFAFAANMDPSGVKDGVDSNPTFAAFETQAAAEYAQLSPTPGDFVDFQAAIERMWASEPNYTATDLAKIATPVAIADGDHDEAIKREHTEYLARTIPGAKLIIFPDASHFAFLQQPDAFNAAMLGFLKGR
ncbi:MAG TPA: alpha/beta hydrolase [Caulobacteraceae bacterium]|jgi:pimeloyl-ACP methyl ester carboxylesterase|nr:alpha/beta hydrolase [Caulobacteraceae bacterium]